MRRLYFAVYILFFTFTSFSQIEKLMKFETDSESQLFHGIRNSTNKEAEIFLNDLLPSINSDEKTKIIERFLDICSSVTKKMNKIEKNNERIDFLNRTVKSAYLKKFEPSASLYETVQSGKYNSRSAALIHFLVMKKTNIPCALNETSNGLSIIAYPKSESVTISFENPEASYIQINLATKNQFVKFLRTVKLITAEEVAAQPVNEFYEKYFFRNRFDDMSALLAIEYDLLGLAELQNGNLVKSMSAFAKAVQLSDNPRSRFWLISLIEQQLPGLDASTQEAYHVCIAYANLLPELKQSTDNIETCFLKISQSYNENHDEELYDGLYHYFIKSIYSKEIQSKVSVMFFYFKGVRKLKEEKFDEGMDITMKGYELDSTSRDIQKLLSAFILGSAEKKVQPDSVIAYLDGKCVQFPSLKSNKIILSAYAEAYLDKAYIKFSQEQRAEGLQLLKKFESIASKCDIEIIRYSMGNAYGEASAHYWRAGLKKECLAILEEGLKFDPTNDELNRKKRVFSKGH